AIRRRIAELVAYTRKRIGGPGLNLATPSADGMHGSMTAFELPIRGPAKAAALRQSIWKHRIEVPIGERPDRLLVRVSNHFYNSTEEIDRLAETLPAALAEIPR